MWTRGVRFTWFDCKSWPFTRQRILKNRVGLNYGVTRGL